MRQTKEENEHEVRRFFFKNYLFDTLFFYFKMNESLEFPLADSTVTCTL
jgi:hypothetical protein